MFLGHTVMIDKGYEVRVNKVRVNKVGIGIGTVGIPPRLVGSIYTCIYLIVR